MNFHVGCLRINPSTTLQGIPVLDGEMIEFVVNDVVVHEFVELVKVVKGDHGVGVVLRVVVGIPQENANQKVGANASSIAKKVVVVLGYFAVCMFEIAEVVDNRVPKKDWDDHQNKRSCIPTLIVGSDQSIQTGRSGEECDRWRNFEDPA